MLDRTHAITGTGSRRAAGGRIKVLTQGTGSGTGGDADATMALAAQFPFRYHRVMPSGRMDLGKVRDFLDAKEAQRRLRLRQQCEQANRDFQAIANMIVSKYKPKRIWQWGSLLRPERFSEISDIDIALEGLESPETCFAILRDADGMTEFPLDIVELERIHPVHAENIRKKGKLIHEEP